MLPLLRLLSTYPTTMRRAVQHVVYIRFLKLYMFGAGLMNFLFHCCLLLLILINSAQSNNEIIINVSADELGLTSILGGNRSLPLVTLKLRIIGSPSAALAVVQEAVRRVELSAVSSLQETLHTAVLRDIDAPLTGEESARGDTAELTGRTEPALTRAPGVERLHVAAPSSALQAASLSAASSVQATVSLTVYVDSPQDDGGDCSTNTDSHAPVQYSGTCNLRSAFTFCSESRSDALDECIVYLLPPPEGSVPVMSIDPRSGSIEIHPVTNYPSLTLYGNGWTINASVPRIPTVTRLFSIDTSLVSENFFFNLQDAVIQGFSSSDYGGAISVLSGQLKDNTMYISINLNRMSFFNNIAQFGGALHIDEAGGDVSISNCLFRSNSAVYGGSISVENSKNIAITSSNFVENDATSGGSLWLALAQNVSVVESIFNYSSASVGGAISVSSGCSEVRVSQCLFVSNYAFVSGGALVVDSSHDILITDCEFTYNWSFDNAGAIWTSVTDLFRVQNCTFEFNYAAHDAGVIGMYSSLDWTIRSCTFRYNSAEYAGGVFLDDGSHSGLLADCQFYKNIADVAAGAVYVDNSDEVVLSDTSFQYNAALLSAGTLYVTYSDDLEILRCIFINETAPIGAAAYLVYAANAIFQDCDFTNGYASSGGGAIYFFYSDNFLIDSSSFEANSADNSGGSVYSFYCEGGIFSDSHFESDSALAGGSVYLYFSETTVLEDCSFSGNTGATEGGAVVAYFGRYFSVSGCSFTGVTADVGGAFSVDGSEQFSFSDCAFVNNIAIINGGALTIAAVTELSITSCKFDHNVAGSNGGAVEAIDSSRVEVRRSEFHNNSADASGGSVYMAGVTPVVLGSSSFSHNSAVQGGGAIYLLSCKSATLDNTTFASSTVSMGSGSAVWASATELTMCGGNLFSENRAQHGGGTVFWEYFSGIAAPIQSSDIKFENNEAGYGNEFATEGVQLRILNSKKKYLTDYETSLLLLSVEMVDYYGQVVKTDNSTLVTISTEPKACIDANVAYVAGILQQPLSGGVSHFTAVQAFCGPSYHIPIITTSSIDTVAGILALNDSATLFFRPCQLGEIVVNGVCEWCENSFTFSNSSGKCDECPEHTTSCEGNSIYIKEGYWRKTSSSSSLLSCPMGASSCRGGNRFGDDLCNAGYENALCAVCSSGYAYRSSLNTCEACSSPSTDPLLIIAPLLFFCFILVAAYFGFSFDSNNDKARLGLVQFLIWVGLLSEGTVGKEKEQEETRKIKTRFLARTKVYVTLYQILLVAPFVLDLGFPKSYSSVMGVFSVLGLNFAEYSGLSCLWRMDYVDELIIQTLLPIGIAILMFVTYSLHVAHTRYIATSTGSSIGRVLYLRSMYSQVSLTLTYLFLPSIVASIFGMYTCQDVDPDNKSEGSDYYMRVKSNLFILLLFFTDYSITCSSNRYFFGVYWATGMLCVYAIGIPLVYWYLLYAARHDIMSHASETDKEKLRLIKLRLDPIRFLFSSYKPEFWYWELVETFQRIIFTGVLIVVEPGSNVQIIVGLGLALFFIKLYSSYRPYVDDIISSVKSLTQWQIYVVYFIALILQSNILSSRFDLSLEVFLVLAILANVIFEICRAVGIMLVRRRRALLSGKDEKIISWNETVNPCSKDKGGDAVDDEEDGVRMSTFSSATAVHVDTPV